MSGTNCLAGFLTESNISSAVIFPFLWNQERIKNFKVLAEIQLIKLTNLREITYFLFPPGKEAEFYPPSRIRSISV